MTDKKYYMWVVPTILVVGLLVGLVFSSQPAQAVSKVPASIETHSAEVGNAPTATGPVCTTNTTDAISYWNFNETSGTTFNDSVGTNDGTCDGDTCPSPVDGTTDGGQFFIDTDVDFIAIESPTGFDWTSESDFSVGAWVKTTQDCSGNKVFVGRYHVNIDGWWIGCVPEVGDTGVGLAAFHMRDSYGFTRRAVGTSKINDGLWHYIVGVRVGDDPNPTVTDDDKNHIYVDGALEKTETTPVLTGNFFSGTDVTIGAYDPAPYYYFNGTLDEVAIFSTALTGPDMATCTFDPVVGDVDFEVDFNTLRVITDAELLLKSSDPDSAPLSITEVDFTSEKGVTIVGDPPGGPYTSATYNPDEDSTYIGTDFFTFTVSDGTNTAPGTAILIQNKPVITDPGDQTDNEGATVSLQIVAVDPNGDTLTYAATGLPADLSIDATTGEISGTVAYTASPDSPYSVTVTVTDTDANATNVEFLWNINYFNASPEVQDPGDQESEEGWVISLQINAEDPNGDSLTFSNIAPFLLPPGLTIDPISGEISGTIAAGASSSSPYTVVIGVSDGVTTPDETTFTWSLFIEINDPPVIDQPEDQMNDEGETIIPLQIVANDPDGDTLEYSALGLPGGLTIDLVTGEISGTIAMGTSGSSPYNVTVTVEDPDSLQDSASFAWTVNSQMNKIYLPLVTKQN